MKSIKMFIMFLAVVPLLMVGCKKEGKSGSTSNLKFYMVDAPANFDSLNIDIQSVQVHSTTAGWVTLTSSAGVVNVLSYVNGNSLLVAQGDIAAGSIDQIRLVLGSNNSVVVHGSSIGLSAASSAALQAGLTINATGQLQAGGNYVFTIDFDAAQSVTTTGGSNFQFNPVIRLIVNQTTTVNAGGTTGSGSGSASINIGGTLDSITGSAGGSVIISGSGTGNLSGSLSSLSLASVCVTGSNGSTFCTMTNITGQFSMQAIAAGTYTVTITPMVSITGSATAHTLSNVTITAGQTTNLGVVAM
jgi:hypothetical protein